ncbi:MAG: ABC transporter permease subunit [Chloroflexi bacterium]|nr:ABC transporter permease subunit [Chloroflexota bacterium]
MMLLPAPRVLAAELLKVRKRWLPYVLFLVMVIGVAAHIWLLGYATWADENNAFDAFFHAETLRTFVLPHALPALLQSGQFWGSMLVGILTASVVGTEYSWGTARQALLRGQTRSEYLTLKLIGLVMMASVGLLAALGIGILFSLMASAIAGEEVSGSTSFGAAILMVLRAGYTIMPYGLLAFALTTVSRSTTLGVAGSVIFVVLEAIMIAVFSGIGTAWSETARAFLPGHNVAAILSANRIDEGAFFSLAPREQLLPVSLPDPTVAALVLALYCLVFLAISYAVFQRRDLQ